MTRFDARSLMSWAAAGLVVAGVRTGTAWAAHPTVDAAAILALEDQRAQAMVNGDVEALRRLLADDLVYAHSSGKVDTKASFLAAISSGALKYKSFQRREPQVRVYGAVAIVTGKADVQVELAQQPSSLKLRFTDVYVRQPGGRWQMVTWQSTRLPD